MGIALPSSVALDGAHHDAGTVDCILSYCHNSLNDDSLLGMLDYLESKGVGVINASPFSMGLLTPQVGILWM